MTQIYLHLLFIFLDNIQNQLTRIDNKCYTSIFTSICSYMFSYMFRFILPVKIKSGKIIIRIFAPLFCKYLQGSHATLKTGKSWKMKKTFQGLEKTLNFKIFTKVWKNLEIFAFSSLQSFSDCFSLLV